MSGRCLCGDPYCGRCYSDPQKAECRKCGGPIYASELPYREFSYEDKCWLEERQSDNIIFTEKDGKRVPEHVKCPLVCETCGVDIPEGECYELSECPACRDCYERAEAAFEARYDALKENGI